MAEHIAPVPALTPATSENVTDWWRISPLELLHPDGVARHSLVIGGNCPAMLLPELRDGAGRPADLILIAPTLAECRDYSWRVQAAQLAAGKLAAGGVVYVLAPPRWRRSIITLLSRHGLSIDLSIVHLPDWDSPRHLVLVPLEPFAMRYALSNLIQLSYSRRRLALAALRLPGGTRLLGYALPSVGLAARQQGPRPLLDWLFRLDDEDGQPGRAILSTRWYGPRGTAVLHRFSGCEEMPSAVVKVPLTATTVRRRVREAAIQAGLATTVRRTGVRVSPVTLVTSRSGSPILLQSALSGQSAATLLAERPQQLSRLMISIGRWLRRWHRATTIVKTFDSERLDQELLAPARLLAPFLEQGQAYLGWLTARCTQVAGAATPFVATHNDLTMWNLLLNERGQLGLVDWEQAQHAGLPLVDFYYAMADAVAASRRYADRPLAFADCFMPGGAYMPVVRQLEQHLRLAVAIPAACADLYFHACWLQHAANEHGKKQPDEPRPFLQILQWLVRHRVDITKQMAGGAFKP